MLKLCVSPGAGSPLLLGLNPAFVRPQGAEGRGRSLAEGLSEFREGFLLTRLGRGLFWAQCRALLVDQLQALKAHLSRRPLECVARRLCRAELSAPSPMPFSSEPLSLSLSPPSLPPPPGGRPSWGRAGRSP